MASSVSPHLLGIPVQQTGKNILVSHLGYMQMVLGADLQIVWLSLSCMIVGWISLVHAFASAGSCTGNVIQVNWTGERSRWDCVGATRSVAGGCWDQAGLKGP